MLQEFGSHQNTSGKATEQKCKFVLAKSPESLQYFLRYRVNSKVARHIHTYGWTYGTAWHYIPRLIYRQAARDNKATSVKHYNMYIIHLNNLTVKHRTNTS